MADTTKANALCKAAKSGDAGKIRELLGSGAPINAADLDRMTPVMLAAQAGQVQAFRTLVEHGADLHYLAMDQVDLLECAAEGGNVEILRFLIEQGHPIEGHWQPRSRVAERTGHLTPLLMAAINGHVEAVRLLLEAGANREAKFDGQTALKMLMSDIKHPNDAVEAERVPQLKKIVARLSEVSAGPRSPDESVPREVGEFAQNARRPEYQRLRRILAEQCGGRRAWQPLPDHGLPAAEVVGFTLVGCKQQKALEDLQQEARTAGCHLVLAEAWAPGEDAALVLFPTNDKLAVVAAVGTEGANYGVQSADVIAWLKQVEEENPFNLIFCGHDLVGGAFLHAVKGPRKLAAKIVEFCPGCLDEGVESPEELALVLKKRRAFLLRWA